MYQGHIYVNAYMHVSTTQMVKIQLMVSIVGPFSQVKYYKPFSNKLD